MLYGLLIRQFKCADTVSATTKRRVVVLKNEISQSIIGADGYKSGRCKIYIHTKIMVCDWPNRLSNK